jgi:hypothetical protein
MYQPLSVRSVIKEDMRSPAPMLLLLLLLLLPPAAAAAAASASASNAARPVAAKSAGV